MKSFTVALREPFDSGVTLFFPGESSVEKDRISEILALVNRMEKTTPPYFSIREFVHVMPSSGLCRVITANGFVWLVSSFVARHDQKFFRKANRGSSALKRSCLATPCGWQWCGGTRMHPDAD